jgi:hypothetical protein
MDLAAWREAMDPNAYASSKVFNHSALWSNPFALRVPIDPRDLKLKYRNAALQITDGTKDSLRWAVGGNGKLRSSTWRLWGNKKGDIYLALRSLGGVLKTSFHADGNSYVGFTKDFADKSAEEFEIERRHWAWWRIPEVPLFCAAEILIPFDHLTVFVSDESPQTAWLPLPPEAAATNVRIYLAGEDYKGDWPGRAEGFAPLGFVRAGTRMAWVVHSTSWFGEERTAQVAKLLDRGKAKIRGLNQEDLNSDSLRVVIWSSRTDRIEDCLYGEFSVSKLLNFLNKEGCTENVPSEQTQLVEGSAAPES